MVNFDPAEKDTLIKSRQDIQVDILRADSGADCTTAAVKEENSSQQTVTKPAAANVKDIANYQIANFHRSNPACE